MKVKAIKKVVEKISERFLLPKPVVTAFKRDGETQLELRTEISGYDMAYSNLIEDIEKIDKDYICEPQGGCVYVVYKPC